MRILLSIVALFFLAGCGVTHASGACADYEPANFCSDGYVYVCSTNDEGCKRCGCAPTEGQNSTQPQPGWPEDR